MAHLETTAVEKAEYGCGCDIEEIKQIDIKDTQVMWRKYHKKMSKV